MKHKVQILLLILAAATFTVGYTYTHGYYGWVEIAVLVWGYFAQLLGIILFCLFLYSFIAFGSSTIKLTLFLNIIIQVPPILLWFIFHGGEITEPRNSQFIAHWAYSLMHIFILVVCVLVWKLFKGPKMG